MRRRPVWRPWGTPGESEQAETKAAVELQRSGWFEGRHTDRFGSRPDDIGSVGRKGKTGQSGLRFLAFTAGGSFNGGPEGGRQWSARRVRTRCRTF